MAIQGPLREMGIHDVFQLLDLSKKTGVLRVESPARTNSGRVHFRNGSVVFAELASNPHRLGELLLRGGRISRDEFERVRELQEAGDNRRFGEILVAMGADLPSDVDRHVLEQVEEVVFEMLSWREGHFSFSEGNLPPHPWDATVRIPTDTLLMNGARRIDEWSRIRTKIPGVGVVPRFAPSAADSDFTLDLFPREWEVLALVDGVSNVDTIASSVGQSSLEVARVLFGLESAGLITFAEEDTGSTEQPGRAIADLVARIEDEVADRGAETGLALATEAISQYPGDGVLLLVRGRIFRDRGRLADAEQDFRDALRADPLLGPAHRELGEALAAQGKVDEAREWLKRWLGTGSFTAEEPEETGRVEEILATVEGRRSAAQEGSERQD